MFVLAPAETPRSAGELRLISISSHRYRQNVTDILSWQNCKPQFLSGFPMLWKERKLRKKTEKDCVVLKREIKPSTPNEQLCIRLQSFGD
jgi:hypothetical protein